MLKIILIVVAVAIAGFLAYAATLPDLFRVSRSVVVQTTPENVFPLINDMQRFNTWNPFNKKDPNIKGTYSGPTAGPGAKYAFQGNKDVGSGDLEITESTAPSRVVFALNMVAPMKASNKVTFTIQPEGSGTRVTWAMEGESPYFAKLIHVFIDMDKMVGKEFENGLTSLKAIGESPARG